MNEQLKKPWLITRNVVVLPGVEKKIEIGRTLSIQAIKKAVESDDKEIILVPQRDPKIERPKFSDLPEIGVICRITDHEVVSETEHRIKVVGLKRVYIKKLDDELVVESPEVVYEQISPHQTILAWEFKNEDNWLILSNLVQINEQSHNSEPLKSIIHEMEKTVMEHPNLFTEFEEKYEDIFGSEDEEYAVVRQFVNDFSRAIDVFASVIWKSDVEFLFNVLSEITIMNRLQLVEHRFFQDFPDEEKEREAERIIDSRLNEAFSKQQKEFILREKLRILKEELGEISNRDDDIDKLRERFKNNPYPAHIKEKALQELNHLESTGNPNEAGIVKSYVEWLADIPWWQESKDNDDLKNVEKVLDKNHYGINKVKERIIEYIATKINNPNSKSPIICLVGPPGVGKTSLAMSIAEALDKKFVKVALGGVKDESEIRGHRRTYLGAMPGRIIKGMKKAGVINPLFLLDEIDKMGSDYKGDPSSAMLEVLDPEQNKTFSDNYIEEDYDLSNVMFIATANFYDQIPYALMDRLEVIELSSYTANEKKEIAKTHLIKRVLENLRIKQKDLKFTDAGIDHIINYYTREAGVRELERMIQKIVRKVLVAKLKGEEYPTTIGVKEVEKYLGKKRFDLTLKDKTTIPGIVNGMAYTAAGGDLLPIEATFFKGDGKLIITGNLEKTMSESVSVALGYVKANADKFGIDPAKFKENDIHIHVPAGGIPKDGPSAGVTLTTAIISVFRNESVPTTISMTGEITLRGKVGIIGGVKEKVISAYRAGIREIFLPKDDERFLEDVPEDIRSDINFHLVERYEEIFKAIFKK